MNEINPPPSLVELIKSNANADRTWKTWFNNLYEWARSNMNKDFFFEVARGNVNGHTAYNISAHSGDVGTTIKTIGQYGASTQYVYPTTASIDYISSDNAGDTHTLTIIGLDANYVEVIQTATLTGTTPVALTTPIFRVNFFLNDTATVTAGTVFLWDSPSGNGTEHTAGVPTVASTVKAFINKSTGGISDEHHLSSVFTVPANKDGYIVFGKTTVVDAKALELTFWVREQGKVFKQAHHIDIKDANYDYFFKVPAKIASKSDIEVKALIDVGTGEASAHYDIILVDK